MKSTYICPILTSVNQDGSVNFDDMHGMYDYVLDAGVDGILIGGSSGEFYAFTYEENKAMMLDAIQHINHRGYVMCGTGRLIKSETISLSNEVLVAGADAVIVVGPYYSGCNEEHVFAYYDDILSQINGPVYLYNYADRTGYDVSPEVMLRLLEKHKNFVGVKDTHPLLRHSQKLVQMIKPQYPDFKIVTGYDNNCIPLVISGGDGCIGALSNVRPDMCNAIIQALANEDLSALKTLQREVDTYFQFYEVYTPFNPVMKWALHEMGKPMQEYCKEPLKVLTPDEKEKLSFLADQLWR